MKIEKIYQTRLNELRVLGFTVDRTSEADDFYQIFPKNYICLGNQCGDSYGPKFFQQIYSENHFEITLYISRLDEVRINILKLLGYEVNSTHRCLRYTYRELKNDTV